MQSVCCTQGFQTEDLSVHAHPKRARPETLELLQHPSAFGYGYGATSPPLSVLAAARQVRLIYYYE
jgi:hypothetical protein